MATDTLVKVSNVSELLKSQQSKPSFVPTDPVEIQYIADIQRKYNDAVWQFTQQYIFLNNLSPLDRFQRNLEDSVVFQQPLPDPQDWRNALAMNTQKDKSQAYLSFLESLNLNVEVRAQDLLGKEVSKGGKAAEMLVRYAMDRDDYKEKRRLYQYGMSNFGLQNVRVRWVEKPQVRRVEARKFDPADIKKYSSKLREMAPQGMVQTEFLQMNRVLYGDWSQYYVNDQPYLFIEYFIPYEVFIAQYAGWERSKFVQPYTRDADRWTDVESDYELWNASQGQYVRMRVFECLPRKEYALFANSVLMTPVGMALPDGCYSVVAQANEIINPNFPLGRSDNDATHNYSKIKDVFTNIMLDTGRQILEPPLQSTFRQMFHRHMWKPGTVTNVGSGELKPLIPQSTAMNFVFEVYKILESSIDKSSVAPIFQGQSGSKSRTTKYEIQQQLYNALRSVELKVQAAARLEWQIASKMLDLALAHYTETPDVSKQFAISSPDGKGVEELMFKKKADRAKGDKEMKSLMAREAEAKRQGIFLRTFLADPEDMREWRYSLRINIIPDVRESKALDQEQITTDYMTMKQDPQIDPMFPTRMWLREKGYDPDEAMVKAAGPGQGLTPGMPGVPVPGVPFSPGVPSMSDNKRLLGMKPPSAPPVDESMQ